MGTFHCYLSLPEGFSWLPFSCEFFGTKTQVEQLRAEGNKRGEVSSDGMASQGERFLGKFLSSHYYYVNGLSK